MTVMGRKQFEIFRQSILSKANGANIHFVNGQLGLIAEAVSRAEKYSELETLTEKQSERYKRCRERYTEAMVELRYI